MFGKYRDNSSEHDGDDVHWGRVELDGVPFRGRPSLLHAEEYETHAVYVADVYVKRFNCLNEDELEEYRKVMDLVANGRATILAEDTVHDAENWYEMVKYQVTYVEDARRRRANGNQGRKTESRIGHVGVTNPGNAVRSNPGESE